MFLASWRITDEIKFSSSWGNRSLTSSTGRTPGLKWVMCNFRRVTPFFPLLCTLSRFPAPTFHLHPLALLVFFSIKCSFLSESYILLFLLYSLIVFKRTRFPLTLFYFVLVGLIFFYLWEKWFFFYTFVLCCDSPKKCKKRNSEFLFFKNSSRPIFS